MQGAKRCQSPPSLSSYKQRVTSIKAETMLRFFLKLGGGAVALQQATPPVVSCRQIRPGSGASALPLQPCIFTRSSRPRVTETPRASGSAPSLHLHPRHFLSSFSSHLSLYSTHHHLLSTSGAVPKKANGFSLIKGFYICHCVPKNTKQRKPLPSPLWKEILGTIDYFYCLSRHTSFIIWSLCQMSESRISKWSRKKRGLWSTRKNDHCHHPPPLPHQAVPKMERSPDSWRRTLVQPRKHRRAPLEDQEKP